MAKIVAPFIRVGLPGEYVDPGIDCTKDWLTGKDSPSLTVQADAEHCDINHIMKRFEQTGLITHVNNVEAAFADVSSLGDYHTALNRVIAVQDAFDDLPAHIRAEFKNDPSALVEAVKDPSQQKKLVELGLISAPDNFAPPAASEAAKGGEAVAQATQGLGA